eukprot:TRINITY_DN6711_c0_g1_i2.p1 TRINITY_DN6711_c0_g1~~TRINITY_DN6711_c0_g1_i2.p1  ORF type:complete len:279 (-),score=55.02 TRINITY_DN6711_c0_g1_i2:22-834(-)
MGKYAQLVLGPAGCGKSTYCNTVFEHCESIGRSIHVINLDPAAEVFQYPVSIDIRDLITLDDVMEELEFGPNGGLMYCMEYLVNNISWLRKRLGDYDNDYLVFDLPGQIELYTHSDIIKRLVGELQKLDYRICALYCMDCHFMSDSGLFLSATLQCLSAMIHLEVPHLSLITKMDLLPNANDEEAYRKFFETDLLSIMDDIRLKTPLKYHNLNRNLAEVIEDYNMITYLPVNIEDEDCLISTLAQIDNCLQYGEDEEPTEPNDEIQSSWI